jgi:predicted transposase/invertase (TIGR01784 family)
MEFYNENSRYISFTSDYGFKVTFGNESDTLFLRKALQALIGSKTAIESIVFDKTTFESFSKDARSGIFDIICKDENRNTFIVEMQLSDFKFFFQRMKFYVAQKFSTLIKKGDFVYNNLTKIYCVGILAKSISPFPHYHNVGTIKNQDGEIMDDQTIYITVELDKFNLLEKDCNSDLEKLLFTMKTVNANLDTETIVYPKFWTEEWLQIALHELDTRAMSPEKRMHFEMTVSNNAIAIHEVNAKVSSARQEGELIGRQEGLNYATDVIKLYLKGINPDEIAKKLNLDLEFVISVLNKIED